MPNSAFLQDHNNRERDTGPMSRYGACMRPYTFAWVGLLLIVSICAVPSLVGETNFRVPLDLALRVRLDDTLTSTDSEVGDPFSATVVDAGEYRNARIYGHISQIDLSGHVKGHTS